MDKETRELLESLAFLALCAFVIWRWT